MPTTASPSAPDEKQQRGAPTPTEIDAEEVERRADDNNGGDHAHREEDLDVGRFGLCNEGDGDSDSKRDRQEGEGERGELELAELVGLSARILEQESLYYDATTMAGLNPFSLAALNRLRAHTPPRFPLWDALPVRRRAAVLLLLYADRAGDLRVVITMRAASLRSFGGHAALPGGKADGGGETPYQIARREAFEEIGLPMEDGRLPRPFRIEPICLLAPALSRTHLVVRPCVAFIHADADSAGGQEGVPLVDESLMPRLDAREVAAVFSAPFYNFLKAEDLPAGTELPPGRWYEGAWSSWKGLRWRVHNFYVPVGNQRVARPPGAGARGSAGEAPEEQEQQEQKTEPQQEEQGTMTPEGRFRVWGMTGRLLVDAARVAYGEEPEMEHNASYGDAEVILRAEEEGVFWEGEGRKHADGEAAKM